VQDSYGDDSFGRKQGGHQGCCVFAGYVTDGPIWKDIAEDWKNALDGPPKIDYFRMSECFAAMEGKESNSGQFRGFSSAEATSRLNALVGVLEKHGQSLAWVHSIITWDTFLNVLTESEREYYKTPYFFCVRGVIEGCEEMLRAANAPSVDVQFVFDEQPGLDLLIHLAWNITKLWADPKDIAVMGGLSFCDDKKVLPLQCADLLAWHVRRNFVQPVEDHGRPREEYTRLKQSANRLVWTVWNEEKFRNDREDLRRRLSARPL